MIDPGTAVTFVVAKLYRHSITISAREGVMVEYDDHVCEVKMRNGRVIPVKTHLVRLQGEHNALTEAVLANLKI